jgi:peptidoglycan/xylan/chitin deacetylase (PgdA/CDA1 family)
VTPSLASREAIAKASGTPPRIVVIFRNDDPSACSDANHERRVAAIFERYGVPQTIGVIPRHAADETHDPRGAAYRELGENPAMVDFLREYVARSGSEVALHGYTHRTNRRSQPSRREYFEFRRLSAETQAAMIRRGTEIIERELGVRPSTFIPPWNRLDRATLRACAQTGYKIVSAGLFTEPTDGLVTLGTNHSVEDLPGLLTASAGSDRIVLMVLYHSRTTETPEEVAALERAVQAAATHPGCEVLTLAETVRRYPDVVRLANEAARNVAPQDEVFGSRRARATVYRRGLAKLRSGKRLEGLYKEACRFHEKGQYREACALTPQIERQCRRLVFSGRAAAALAGGFAGIGLCVVMAARPSPAKVAGYCLAGGLVLMLGALMRWRMTAEDSKREVWAAALTAWLGALAAASIGELVTAAFR